MSDVRTTGKNRIRIAGMVLGPTAFALVIGLFGLSAFVGANEPTWREQGCRFPASAQMAVDIGSWWYLYGWLVVLIAAQFILAVGLVRLAKRSLTREAKSAEERDFVDSAVGSPRAS